MTKGPEFTETHERRATVLFDHKTLDRMIRAEALRLCGMAESDAVTVSIKIEDETTGSPAYRIGTKARVTVVEDQMRLPRAQPARGT